MYHSVLVLQQIPEILAKFLFPSCCLLFLFRQEIAVPPEVFETKDEDFKFDDFQVSIDFGPLVSADLLSAASSKVIPAEYGGPKSTVRF